MRDYETIIILKADANDAIVKGLAKKVEKILEGKPGKITKKDDWGVRKLACPIKHEKKAHYLFWSYAHFPSVLGQLDRVIRFDENVLRYMTVTLGEHGKIWKKDVEKAKKETKRAEKETGDEEERRYSRPVKIDYKDPATLAPFLTDRGKIVPQRQSRLTALEQRNLAQAVKRARQIALLSHTTGLSMSREPVAAEGYAP